MPSKFAAELNPRKVQLTFSELSFGDGTGFNGTPAWHKRDQSPVNAGRIHNLSMTETKAVEDMRKSLSQSNAGAVFRALQLLPDSFDDPLHTRNGKRIDRTHLDYSRVAGIVT